MYRSNLSRALITLLFSLSAVFLAPNAFSALEPSRTTVDDQKHVPPSPNEVPSFGLEIQFGSTVWSKYEVQPETILPRRAQSWLVSFEWMPVQSLGKLSLGIQGGFSYLSNVELGANRFASVYGLPLIGYAAYRLDFIQNQLFVPFAKIGRGVIWTQQTSKTGGQKEGIQHRHAWNYSVGLEICLNRLDPKSSRKFQQFVGVDNSYLTLEYQNTRQLNTGSQPNLSASSYRIGLRFEI